MSVLCLHIRCRRGLGAALFICALLCPLAFAAPQALAHGVFIFAWPEGGRLCSESYFGKSGKVRGGEVRLFSVAGDLLAEGRTDEKGLICFDAPATAQDILFVVSAGQGHRAEFLLPEKDVAEAASRAAPASGHNSGFAAAPAAPEPDAAASRPDDAGSAALVPAADPNTGAPLSPALEAAVRAAVREEVERAVTSLRRQLTESAQGGGPGLRDIVGGLGWIAGLAGLAALYAARRKS